MTNKTLIPLIFTALTCLLYQTPLYSGVYKWADDNGLIHYSDQPNEPNAKEFTVQQIVTTKSRPIKTDDKKDKNAPEVEGTEQAIPETVEPEAAKISASEKRKLCNEAKSDVSAIASRGRMREVNAKGEYVYLSEKQLQQRLSAAKKKQREYCR